MSCVTRIENAAIIESYYSLFLALFYFSYANYPNIKHMTGSWLAPLD